MMNSRVKQRAHFASLIGSISALVSCAGVGVAYAEEYNPESDPSADTKGYTPPTGEQPDYEKTYRPSVPQVDLVLEVNPLLLINRGISAEFEKQFSGSVSLGGDLIYRDAEVHSESGVKGRVQYLGIAPKVRFYPFSTLAGVFFGGKMMIGQNTLTVSDDQKKSEQAFLTVSPTVHTGYRFTSFSGFTFAAYVGGGVNLPRVELKSSDLDESRRDNSTWKSAKDDVNAATGLFRPDFGITLGIAL